MFLWPIVKLIGPPFVIVGWLIWQVVKPRGFQWRERYK